MSPDSRLQTLRSHLEAAGPLGTVRRAVGHGRRRIADSLEGTPGYYSLRLRLLARRYEDLDVLRPVWVSPDRIEHLAGGYERRTDGHLDHVPQFRPREAGWDLPCEATVPYGTIRGGDWDRERAPFNRLLVYQAIKARYERDVSWPETEFYQDLLSQFADRGFDREGARTRTRKRCEKIDRLADRLREEGYRSQRELDGHPLHEVTVLVGRDGTVLYNSEGRHRLSVAKVLDLDQIPVLVLVRHAEADGALE